MKIQFHGAAGGVTGSKHLVEVGNKKILLDCGMYQGRRKEADTLNRNFPFNAKEIDAVILSHAHIDHSGLLPILAKNGYAGDIFCTPATSDIMGPMLLDAAHIQEADAAYFMRKKNLRKNAVFPIDPLFTTPDAEATLKMLVPKKRGKRFEVLPGIFCTFINAGHVLGSAQVILEGDGKTLAFTGDYGRKNRKIIRDPDPIPKADAIITESTYGGRTHEPISETREHLGEIVRETSARGGKLIIPSFALERSQEVLYDLHILFHEKKIPSIPVFVDSPLATKFTKIFAKNKEVFDEHAQEYFLNNGKDPFSFSQLKHTANVEESKVLNYRPGPFIVISASGMCEAGRIRHHLKNSISDPRNTILIVGYQAVETLGRKLVEKRKIVRIFDEMYPVKADIRVLNGYSGHGDQDDLLENIRGIQRLQKIFIVHGDPDQSLKFAEKLASENREWEITIPKPGEEFSV
jgi:metallo-beta-lactamase family protein